MSLKDTIDCMGVYHKARGFLRSNYPELLPQDLQNWTQAAWIDMVRAQIDEDHPD